MDESVESNLSAQRVTDNVRRARFRSVPAATVEALNRIHRPRQSLHYTFESQSMTLTPVALGPALYAPYRVALNMAAVMGPLDVDRYLVKRLIGLIDPDLAESELSTDALKLALLHVLAEPLENFESVSGYRLEPGLQPIEEADHTGKAAFDFEIKLENDQASARARLWVPHASLLEFSRIYDRLFPLRPNDLPIFLPMHLLAGRCRLSIAEVNRLAIGDVLLIEDIAGPWPSAWLVIANKRRVALSMEERQARIKGTLEHYMSDQPDVAVDDGSVDDLEVDIKFELGRAQMPLRQLKMLAEGGVIPLERDYRSPVDVIVGGRRVGEGEIVDIDGRIGVRLVRFQGK